MKRQKASPSLKAAVFSPIAQPQNEGLNVDSTEPTHENRASLNASLYAAAEGEFGGNGEESPFFAHTHHALENKEHEGNLRQEVVSSCKFTKLPQRRTRDSDTCSQVFVVQRVKEIAKISGAKSSDSPADPQSEQLASIVLAWSSLPDNIREAILLLIRQYVQ